MVSPLSVKIIPTDAQKSRVGFKTRQTNLQVNLISETETHSLRIRSSKQRIWFKPGSTKATFVALMETALRKQRLLI